MVIWLFIKPYDHQVMKRPEFDSIKTYAEFKKYKWTWNDLVSICKEHGLKYQGTEEKLLKVIEAYFNGVKIPPKRNWYSHVVLNCYVNDNGMTLIFDFVALLVSAVLLATGIINMIMGKDELTYVLPLVFGAPVFVLALVWSYCGRDIDVIKSYFPACGDKSFTRAQVDEQANSKEAKLLDYGDIILAPDMLIGVSAGVTAVAYEDISSLQVKQTWHTERIGPRYSTRYREYYTYKIIVRTNKGKSVAISRSETDACYAVKAVHEHCLTHNPDVKLLGMKKSSLAPDKSSKQVVSGKGVRSSVDKAVSDQFLTSVTVPKDMKKKLIWHHLKTALIIIPVALVVGAGAAFLLNMFLGRVHNTRIFSPLIPALFFPVYAVYNLISTLITIVKDDVEFYSGEIAGKYDMDYDVKGVNGYRFGYLKSLKPDTEPKEGDKVIIARFKEDFSLIKSFPHMI